MRYIRCLLCKERKPYVGFLTHIRQEHLNYNRYKCKNCSFECDAEEDTTLHHFQTNHDFELGGNNYQEHLAFKIFHDCYREEQQFPDQCETEKKAIDVSGETNKKDDESISSTIRGVSIGGTSRVRKKGASSSSSSGRQIIERRKSKNRRSSEVNVEKIRERKKLIPVRKSESLSATNIVTTMKDNDTCADDRGRKQEDEKQNVDMEREMEQTDENIPILMDSDSKKKPKSDSNITKVPLKTSDSDGSRKLPKTDKQSYPAMSSSPLVCPKKIENTSSKKPRKVKDDDVIVIDEEINKPAVNTSDKKRCTKQDSIPQSTESQVKTVCRKCGELVNADYIARKAHALQFHFTARDDPEIDELLPETVKVCFPLSTSSSDYECTDCGKAFRAVSSRRKHVLKEHFYWHSSCPLSGCTADFHSLKILNEHLMLEHNIQKSKVPKKLEPKLKKIENEWKTSFTRQLKHCFPCPIPPKKQLSSIYEGLPKASISDILSSILNPHTPMKPRETMLLSSSSSSDTESSSAEDEDSSRIKGKKPDIKLQRKSGTEGCETLDSTASKRCSMDMTLSEQQLCCTLCGVKVAKKLLESHAWSHLPETVQADSPLPFQCKRCEFAACRIPDALCHAKEEHGITEGDAFISKVSQETLELFLSKVTECFPPLKRDS